MAEITEVSQNEIAISLRCVCAATLSSGGKNQMPRTKYSDDLLDNHEENPTFEKL